MAKRQQILKDAVDAIAASYIEVPEDAAFYPAEVFEQATGLKKISANYIMPDGKTPELIQAEIGALNERCMGAGMLLRLMKQGGKMDWDRLAAREAKLEPKLAALEKKKDKWEGKGRSLEEHETLGDDYYVTRQNLAELQGLRAVHEAYGKEALSALESFLEKAEARRHAVVTDLFDAIVTLNPELAVLEVDRSNTSQMDDVVLGAVSHFNVADIKFFSIDQMSLMDAEADPKWRKNMKAAEKRTGEQIGWVPAPSTLDNIIRQLDKREEKSNVR